MPFVTVRTVKGVFNEIQRQDIMEGITEVISKVSGSRDEGFKESVWVVVEEQEPSHWFFGGKSPNPELLAHHMKHHEEEMQEAGEKEAGEKEESL